MPSSPVSDLRQTLIRFRLATPAEIDDCLVGIPPESADIEPILERLERKGLLTPYQSTQLRKGDASALVLGEFALQYRNASGSFARVYRAKSLRDGRMVGLKVLRKRWCEDPKAVTMFRREAQLGMTLKHDNIVPIYQVAKDGDQHFLVMEFVEGGNLREFINIRKQLAPLEATKCTLEMALGLSYALSKGMTHRDLKMTNVLMSSRGVARLVDFGLAGLETGDGSDSMGGESAQRALEYATLEKGTNAPRQDPRSDLYFLGAMYYELLTGIPPLPRTRDRNERSQFSRYSSVRPLAQTNPSIPRCVTKIVDRLMHLNPDARYQTPGEAAVDLKAALIELGAPAPDIPEVSARPAAPAAARTVMCIESRLKHQDLLRSYLSKHGYRVLMLSDLQRGLKRLQESPPDCVLLMGDDIGEEVVAGFETVTRLAPAPACCLVLAEKQAGLKSRLRESETARVLVQPVSLHDVHRAIRHALRERRGASPSGANGKDEE